MNYRRSCSSAAARGEIEKFVYQLIYTEQAFIKSNIVERDTVWYQSNTVQL